MGLAIGGSAGRFSFRQGRFGVRGACSRFPRSPAPIPAVGQRPATAWASFRSLRRRGPGGAGATLSVTTAGEESGGQPILLANWVQTQCSHDCRSAEACRMPAAPAAPIPLANALHPGNRALAGGRKPSACRRGSFPTCLLVLIPRGASEDYFLRPMARAPAAR